MPASMRRFGASSKATSGPHQEYEQFSSSRHSTEILSRIKSDDIYVGTGHIRKLADQISCLSTDMSGLTGGKHICCLSLA
jgi:hypothetical protein